MNDTRTTTAPCPACQRPNGLARATCLYCGAALPLHDPTLQKPTLRVLEEWEHGFNVISCPRSGDAPDYHATAAWLNMEATHLQQIADAATPLPVVRVATAGDAELVSERLRKWGWPAVTVSDLDLAVPETPAKRISRMDWRETGLTAYPTGGSAPFSIAWNEVKLLVTGHLFARQVETTERPKGRREEKELIEARETSNDEAVLDGYGPNLAHNWRIYLNNFDFSCLGECRRLLARENFATLCQELRTRARRAVWRENYSRLRGLLVAAWPLSQRTDARGWQRTGGRVSLQAALLSSNEIQFTRFSRLCYHLAMRSQYPER